MVADDTFRVIVDVIEVQGLIWPKPCEGVKPKLPNPYVEVIVANDSQWTFTREATASCAFNRSFLISNVALSEMIEIRVYHKAFLGQRELIGMYSISVESIRTTPEHCVTHALYTLVIPQRPSEPRGFVRLSINVLKAGELLKTSNRHSLSGSTPMGDKVTPAPRVLGAPELQFDSYSLSLGFYIGEDILKRCDIVSNFAPSTRIQVDFMETTLTTRVCPTTHEPAWCELLRFPATVPCSNDKITIELWLESTLRSQRVSTVKLSFAKILKARRQTFWINFYTENINASVQQNKQESLNALAAFASLFTFEPQQEESHESITGFYYLGRVLFSWECAKLKTAPTPQVLTCSRIAPPPDQQRVLWIDLFELAGFNNFIDVSIQASFGIWEAIIKPEKELTDTLRFSESEGRIPEETLTLPLNLEIAPDLIFRVYGRPKDNKKGARRPGTHMFLAYARISSSSLAKRKDIPNWIDLLPAQVHTSSPWSTQSTHQPVSSSFNFSLLASVALKTPEQTKNKDLRCSRVEFAVDRYVCHLICYQAVNLPVLRASLPSPHVMVSLGGGCATTQTLFHTIHPDWYEMLDFNCTLPRNISLARGLWLQIVSGNVVLGEVSIPVAFLLSQQAQQPQWYPLLSKRFSKSQARVLCSFHLTPLTHRSPQAIARLPETLPWFKIEYEPCDLRLFVVGCRLFGNVLDMLGDSFTFPEIQVEFGRQPDNPNSRLWYGSCDHIARGSNGCFDYFSPLEIKCFLPKSEMFQTYVDFGVFYSCNGESRELGTAYLHLNPHVPQFSAKLRQRIQGEFQYNIDVMEDFALPHINTGFTMDNPFIAPCLRDIRHHQNLSQDASFEILRLAVMDESATTYAMNEEHNTPAKLQTPLQEDDSVYNSDMGVFFSRQASLLKKFISNPNYLEMMNDFVWSATGEEMNSVYEELNRPLESEMRIEELPYTILPIIGPGRYSSSAGGPDVVGILKVRCKIFAGDDDMTSEMEAVDTLCNQLTKITALKTRIHVLSGSGLFCGSTAAQNDETAWYLTVSNCHGASESVTKVHTIKDKTITAKAFAPDFYRSFELDTSFPANSLLTLGIATAETLWSASITVGRTFIDLENRFIHPEFHTLMNRNHNLPVLVETRSLRNVTNNDPTGHLRVFVEILTEEETLKRPFVPIKFDPPEVIEVRVVIWQIKGIPVNKMGSLSLYVLGMMPGVTPDTVTMHETDTHWNSSDGTAVFNWRFLFDVMVPSESNQLRLQVWSRNLVVAHESLAETVFELSFDLMRCKTSKQPVTLERAWVKLFHPANSTQLVGYLDTEIMIVPKDYAIDNPVGIARESPNENPFLPDVEEHRNYISSSILGQTVFGTSTKILYGAKICSWLITLGIILTLYVVFSRIFLS